MIAVYSVVLGVGIMALVGVIILSGLSSGTGRPGLDLNHRLGVRGRMSLGGFLGFGMGGMAAEFSPLDFTWQIALVVAVLAAVASSAWVWYLASKAPTG